MAGLLFAYRHGAVLSQRTRAGPGSAVFVAAASVDALAALSLPSRRFLSSLPVTRDRALRLHDALFLARGHPSGEALLHWPGPAASRHAGRHWAFVLRPSHVGLRPVRLSALQQAGAHGQPAL